MYCIEVREAIRNWMAAPSVIRQPARPSPGFVSHHLTTCRIELTSVTTASVRTYWLVTTAIGLDHNDYYDDQLSARREVGMAVSHDALHQSRSGPPELPARRAHNWRPSFLCRRWRVPWNLIADAAPGAAPLEKSHRVESGYAHCGSSRVWSSRSAC